MNVDIPINKNELKVDCSMLQKMIFLYNTLENGWTIKKRNNLYIFTKNHEGKKEVMLDDYLKRFMMDNLDINNLV